MHACNGRCLKETSKHDHLFTKEVDQAQFHKVPIQLGLGHVEDLQRQEQVTNDGKKIHENEDDENSMKQEESKPFLKEEASKGNKIAETSPNDLRWQAKTERSKGSQGRSMLWYSSTHNTDEAVDSKENDVVEDIVVMDYAQPHRKPPIHNEKP
ncbi:hypothetical protein LWI28_006307 [Acer negundo]|uniref:Uncharacterized protein n=1 Tax=Acer negundo TaxID=4023 RepID=A0AAD5NN32_ACENE|nr:hypothetical protein LWI28_006307 [Acer negundo]KAK4844911.1 hypothetical protein QYF36_025969 [Acer negundo]